MGVGSGPWRWRAEKGLNGRGRHVRVGPQQARGLSLRGLGPGPPAGTRRLPSRRCPRTPLSPRRLPPSRLAAECCPGRRAGLPPWGGRLAPPGGRLGGSEHRRELAAASHKADAQPHVACGKEEGPVSGSGSEARGVAPSAHGCSAPQGKGPLLKAGKKEIYSVDTFFGYINRERRGGLYGWTRSISGERTQLIRLEERKLAVGSSASAGRPPAASHPLTCALSSRRL